ncbi:berberine bridge enzyme-like 17 [Pyrus x bretschneideri]|uniref:berberine bridge enzyme-like 17 n=1 Tax=Pyrus x bretschneideri TaxID=225117 RepID=UPI00202DEADB|nr:berberine bridge enzyme-like 17 [Pyrus x bretschneideri]
MKLQTCPLIFILCVFALSISWATSDSSLGDFFHCLPKHSQSSFPISEAIYTRENTTFPSVLLAYIRNLRHSTTTTSQPLAIVAAKHQSHVQATVICAQQHGVHIRIRSGGHDYEGLSFISYIPNVPYIVLDMFNLRSIDINVTDESAWVQAGAIIGELYFKIAEKSKAFGFPGGVCPTVATGGHFSGGGYGPMMRKYGLATDNIEDAKIVNVNGTILDRKSMGEDLFWAIRGGGGASFGVILSWKIKLVTVPANVTVFKVQKTLEEGAINVLYQWQHVVPKLPKEIFIRATSKVINTITNSTSQEGKNNKTGQVTFFGQFLGQTDQLLSLINESFPELGLQRTDCLEMSWVESTLFFAEYPLGTPINALLSRPNKPPPFFFKGKSDYVKEPIPKEGLESIWKMMIDIGTTHMQWNPYGGRMSEISESDTPFPHRAGNLFMIQYWTYWLEEGIEANNRHLNVSRKLYETTTPFVSKSPREALQNYRDLHIAANLRNQTNLETAKLYGSAYYKGNFERLVRVKSVADPQNFFKHEQSIPPL